MSKELTEYFKANKSAIESSLAPGLSFQDFYSAAMNSAIISDNADDLMSCVGTSLLVAYQKCARDGLLPDGNEAYIKPQFKQTGRDKSVFVGTYIPMIQGVRKRIRMAENVNKFVAKEVYENDIYEYGVNLADGEYLNYSACRDYNNRGDLQAFFALANMSDGEVVFVSMSIPEINQTMRGALDLAPDQVPAESEPWFKNYLQMGLKTVTHRVADRLNLSMPILDINDNPADSSDVDWDTGVDAEASNEAARIQDATLEENKAPQKGALKAASSAKVATKSKVKADKALVVPVKKEDKTLLLVSLIEECGMDVDKVLAFQKSVSSVSVACIDDLPEKDIDELITSYTSRLEHVKEKRA